MSLARRLTDRDRDLARAVARFRVLTTPHLEEMFFGSGSRARVRLATLHRLGVLDRFEPMRPSFGRRPYHYLLGPLGAAVLAAENDEDIDLAVRRCHKHRAVALRQPQRLEHLLGVNGVAAALIGHSRRAETARLLDWLTEAEAARWTQGIVRPDAWGLWHEAGLQLEFFLEYDRGSETLTRLVAKLRDYERFEAERGATAWVLFAFTSGRRETSARGAFAAGSVPIATTVLDGGRPHEAIWRSVRDGARRSRLAELAVLPKPPEATERAAHSSARSWRFERSRPDDHIEEAPIDRLRP